MSTELWTALTRVTARIAEMASRDEELRESIRALAGALVALTDRIEEGPTLSSEAGVCQAVEPVAEAASPAEPSFMAADLPPAADVPDADVLTIEQAVAALTFAGRSELPRSSWHEFPAPPADDELPLIAARCRLKAEGARWAAHRERRKAAGVDFQTEIAPIDRELIARAKAIDGCYLWMNSPDWIAPPDLRLVEDAGGCFDVLAAALEAAHASQDSASRREGLDLLAEAQSAVWAAVSRLTSRPDQDQERAFIWLRETSGRLGHYISRYMRRDDSADPAAWRERAEKVSQFAEMTAAERDRERKRRKLFGKLQYLAGQVAARDGDLEYCHERFAATTEELLDLGVPASNPELCDLASHLFAADEPLALGRRGGLEASPAFQQVLREAARRRERLDNGHARDRAAANASDQPPALATIADVAEAIRRIHAEFPEAIAFPLNGRSEVRGNPFEEPDRLYAALRFLATTYRDARLGHSPCPDLDAECRRRSGFWYRPHQSDSTIGLYADDYRTVWRGRTLTLRHHLGKGTSKDPRHTVRVGFDFDEDQGVVVVGYVGQHQRTRAT